MENILNNKIGNNKGARELKIWGLYENGVNKIIMKRTEERNEQRYE